MRRLKFRAWDRTQKRFMYGGKVWQSDFWNLIEADPDNFVIQQSTGLRDSLGEEIYEGDLVETGEDFTGEVFFCTDNETGTAEFLIKNVGEYSGQQECLTTPLYVVGHNFRIRSVQNLKKKVK